MFPCWSSHFLRLFTPLISYFPYVKHVCPNHKYKYITPCPMHQPNLNCVWCLRWTRYVKRDIRPVNNAVRRPNLLLMIPLQQDPTHEVDSRSQRGRSYNDYFGTTDTMRLNIKYHYFRKAIQNDWTSIHAIFTSEHWTNNLVKPLGTKVFEWFIIFFREKHIYCNIKFTRITAFSWYIINQRKMWAVFFKTFSILTLIDNMSYVNCL